MPELKQKGESDRKVIETLGEVLAGSDRPRVVTSAEFARVATEEAVGALIAEVGRMLVTRLRQTHDICRQQTVVDGMAEASDVVGV